MKEEVYRYKKKYNKATLGIEIIFRILIFTLLVKYCLIKNGNYNNI
jgi:hypothetical protein